MNLGALLTPARLLAAGIVVPLAAVGLALVTQHVFGMQPCPWCVLQRLIFVAISLAALLGLAGHLTRLLIVRRVGAAVMGLLALCGIAAALWQHFVASASTSCNLTLADRIVSGVGVDALWPEVFAPYASCADAAAKLLGVPYEFYSLTLFIGLAAAAMALLLRRRA
ncbi:MAG: disulfide bond formation protein B [Rubrivivax sp.]|nr:disulfide bond formation protein B [Rubrivivax sp.]